MASVAVDTIPKAGLRNTVRFRWIVRTAPLMQREVFGRSFLLNALKLKVDQVFCLQTNAQERSFDVTFSSSGVMDTVMETCRGRAGERPFSNFEILSLDRPNFRLITIHMYNPYVSKEEMSRFLSNYGEVFASTRKLVDSLGFWTGRTQFQVLLKEDAEGFEGLAHPPRLFQHWCGSGFPLLFEAAAILQEMPKARARRRCLWLRAVQDLYRLWS